MSFAVVYPGLFNTKPARTIESWSDLVATLSNHIPSKKKDQQAMWSPVALAQNGTRKNASVQAVNALVIDVDGGTAYETVKESLVGREWVAYSSFSHKESDPHYHVVVKLENPVSGNEWQQEYKRMRAEFGNVGDSLSAPSHAYYLPQHQPGTAYFVEVGK